MGSGPDEVDEIRRQIDQSRENLGDAVGALAYKVDVKNRAKDAISDRKEAVMEKVEELKSKAPGIGSGDAGSDPNGGGVKDTLKSKLPDAEAVKSKLPDGETMKSKVPDKLSNAAPSKDDVKQKAQAVAETAGNNPLAVVAGATAAGFVAGVALPETPIEREKLGPPAQEARQKVETTVRDKVQAAKSTAQSAVEAVKSTAQETAQSAAATVKEQGQQQDGKLGDLAEKAADKAQERVG